MNEAARVAEAVRACSGDALYPRWVLFDYWRHARGTCQERADRCCMRRSAFVRTRKQLLRAGLLVKILSKPTPLYRVNPSGMHRVGMSMGSLFAAQEALARRRKDWP